VERKGYERIGTALHFSLLRISLRPNLGPVGPNLALQIRERGVWSFPIFSPPLLEILSYFITFYQNL
jgi:hypothetical protein